MGYTNYWKRTDKEYDESFVDLVKDVFSSCKQKGITLRDGFGEGEPVADLTDIWFNGDGSKGLDHETFLIPNVDSENFEEGFNFCKTAAKPYDYAVKEVLRLAEKYGYVTDVSDDGEVDVVSDAEYLGESYVREANRNHYPKYVTRDGYIGTFKRVDPGVDGEEIPIYRFPGGETMVDDYELDNGYDSPNADDEYIEITMSDGDVRRYNRDTDLEKFQYDWSNDIRDLVGDDVSSGEIDDIARELFYYELPADEYTEDEVYERIRQILEYDLPNPNADNDAWKLYVDGCKPKKKSQKKQMLTQRKGCVDSCGSRRKSEALHGDLVNQIYSVMMNYEYGYDPYMSDINAMLQDLVIDNGIDNIKSNAFKKAWISAHNKAERKVWGSSGDAMRYDSLTPTEQDAIDDFDEDYWKRWRK